MKRLFYFIAVASVATAEAAAGGQTPPAATAAAAADHLALHVADMHKSTDFYKEAFGVAEIPAPGSAARWLDFGGISLHLIGGRTEPLVPVKSVYLALRTKDLEPTLAFLRKKAIKWSDWPGTEGAINVRADGVRQIFFQDLDGYWLEVNDSLKQ